MKNIFQNKAKKLYWPLISWVLIINLMGCGIAANTGSDSLMFLDGDIEVPYGQKVDITQYLLWGTYDSIAMDPDLFDSIGPQKARISTMFQGKKTDKIITIMVADKTPPVFTKVVEEITIQEGTKLDISKYFAAYDEIDGDIEPKVTVPVDTSTLGTVEIEIMAVDKSGNVSIATVKLVITPKPKPDPTPDNSNSGSGNKNKSKSSGSKSTEKSPKVKGVKDITIKVGSSYTTLEYELTKNITSNVALNISYGSVNLGVPGTYTAYYKYKGEVLASCKVHVK